MDSSAFLNRIDELLVPSDYSKKLVENVPDNWRFYCKGAYIFTAVPYGSVPTSDYSNTYVKTEIRKRLFAFPFFAEKGLFLLYYGPVADWQRHRELHKVDKTCSAQSSCSRFTTSILKRATTTTVERLGARSSSAFAAKSSRKSSTCAEVRQQSMPPGKP